MMWQTLHSQSREARSHALVVGGTGMLRDVSLELTSRFDMVSVTARTRGRLEELRDQAPQRLNLLRFDWHDPASIRRRMAEAISDYGPISLVVCWCHTTAPEAPPLIARMVANPECPVEFMHVIGSGSVESSEVKMRWRDELSQLPGIAYRIVQLGCERIGTNYFRWLSEEQISAGVLEAIDSHAPFTFIGDPIP